MGVLATSSQSFRDASALSLLNAISCSWGAKNEPGELASEASPARLITHATNGGERIPAPASDIHSRPSPQPVRSWLQRFVERSCPKYGALTCAFSARRRSLT